MGHLKAVFKTSVFGELDTAVLVLGLRPRPRSELKTLDRLVHGPTCILWHKRSRFGRKLMYNNKTIYCFL